MQHTKKSASLLQEKEIASALGGQIQAGSGGTSHGGGDVHTDNWFIEAKTVLEKKKSYSIKTDVLNKMKEQMFEQKKEYAALAFRFEPTGKDWYVIDKDTFIYLLSLENKDN